MTKYYKIPQEKIDEIVSLAGTCPKREIMRRTGISPNTVRCIVNDARAGHEIRTKMRATKEALAIVRELYPNTAGVEIDRRQGWPLGTSAYFVMRYLKDVRHSDEFLAARREQTIRQCRENHKLIDHKATGRKLKAKRKLEEMRVWEGKPQLTRMRLSKMSKRAYSARWNLLNNHNYVPDEEDLFTFYYDGQTRRCEKKPYGEDYFTNKYKFKFEKL